MTDLVELIYLEPEKNELAEELWRPVRTTPTLGRITSVSRMERVESGLDGLVPEVVFITAETNYQGEQQAKWEGERYQIYRTYRRRESQEIELYLAKRTGVGPW
ncbi:MAG TPA: hypothetical protein H9719_05365 [Candidatus Intestinimonas stercoravium]|nr:hypothetical protein [Candidatus Intestinimonas stercoravium]